MRLTDNQTQIIRDTARELFGPGARVRLFGSRLDDQARGGDIDLLLELPEAPDNAPAAAARFAARLQRRLGDRRIDVVVKAPGLARQPIHEAAEAEGVVL